MIPAIYNFKEQYAGDTFNGIQLTATLNGSPIDLTNITIKIQFKVSIEKASVKDLIIGTGLTLVDAVNGVFKIDSFTVFTTPNITNYLYDLEFTYSSGVVKTYMKGDFPVKHQITI